MAPLPSLGDTVGVVMITGMLVAALYGITTVQTFIYYQHNKHDPTMLKHSILILWIVGTIQFIFMIHVVYYYGALTVGNLEKLVTMPWSIPAYVIVAGVSDVMVLGWYAHRLWKLSASKWLILIIATGAFTVLVGASYLAALLSKYPDIPTFNKKGGWAWYLKFGPQAFSEILITIFLTRTLLLRRTRFTGTTSIIHTLVAYSVGSCLITSAVSIAAAATYKAYPDKSYHIGLGGLLPKLLLNSLLAMLNSREFFKSVGHSDVKLVPIQLSRLPDSVDAQYDAARDKESHVDGEPRIKIHVDKDITQSY